MPVFAGACISVLALQQHWNALFKRKFAAPFLLFVPISSSGTRAKSPLVRAWPLATSSSDGR
jgi:hypothetical protein